MQRRFGGPQNSESWNRALKAFCDQNIVRDVEIAKALVDKAEYIEVNKGDIVYREGSDADLSIYFLFVGNIVISEKNTSIHTIVANNLFGEFPLLMNDPTYKVTATAKERCLIAKVSNSDFASLAKQHPVIWRNLAEVLAHRLLESRSGEEKAEDRRDSIVVIHGIRDHGFWQNFVKEELSRNGFQVALAEYGWFNILEFISPIPYFQTRAVERVVAQIRQVKKLHGCDRISILAHSFGSYIVAEMMMTHPDIAVDRVVFCGCIVPSDHLFVRHIGHRIDATIVNDVGSRDVWPALARTVGYGWTGTFGFRTPAVIDRWHKGFKHSTFFKEKGFVGKYWVPFFKSGQVVTDESLTLKDEPSWWISLLSKLNLYVVVAAAVLVAFMAYR